ncbi:THUMP domain-containing protein 1 homolog isoform X2 [Cephus cinctus]|nr:THUMP domain-containing protein 1 homolog isoform X2 [Cephus cinctus]XP_015610114.1 THUMP domain-containing protein 1 homolog isoform X2 [Cephus cinctus]XP_024935741.1 THUMP domain-containing protein 1 homolog isoform X2 [Cephus cinctus]
MNKNYQKKRRQYVLEPGMTGFLCTCNFREKDCIRDAYKLLNEFADELYGSDEAKASEVKQESESDKPMSEDKDEDDISTALKKEIKDLKTVTEKSPTQKRFQVMDTGVKNVVFIKTCLSNPLELVTAIIKQLDSTKEQRTRFLLRLLPIEVVCKAYMNDIKSKADILFEKYFTQDPKTFSIVFNRHSNNSIERMKVIEELASIISEKNPGNKADLKNPEVAVVVEVIRGNCLISIAPNYFKYKKYNLLELCNLKEKDDKIEGKDENKQEKDDKEDKVEEKQEETNEEKQEEKKPNKELQVQKDAKDNNKQTEPFKQISAADDKNSKEEKQILEEHESSP